MAVSKTQIDRLGDRLKAGNHTDADLGLLDAYRQSFGEAYRAVIEKLRQSGKSPTGRQAKSTVSIVKKLRRESIRLSQIQDIAGCRVIVADVIYQDLMAKTLKGEYSRATIIDRRDNPSHGYRAVHVIVEVFGKPVEVQVRTSLQHLWAELSEKSSDLFDPTIKYGGGLDNWRDVLEAGSEAVASHDECVRMVYTKFAEHKDGYEEFKHLASILFEQNMPEQKVLELRKDLDNAKRDMMEMKRQAQGALKALLSLGKGKG